MIGIHINLLAAAGREASAFQNPTEEEKRYLGELAHWMREETGYQWIQGTRPQTLAFALTDSPAGLAAWIVEKFRAWSDCGGDVERAISRDRMLADISLYWFTGAIGSSFWPYYARLHGSAILPPGAAITVPTGYAQFPREILKPPRSAIERVHTNIRRWSVMEKGGHFAALEQPDALAARCAPSSANCVEAINYGTSEADCVRLVALPLYATIRHKNRYTVPFSRPRKNSVHGYAAEPNYRPALSEVPEHARIAEFSGHRIAAAAESHRADAAGCARHRFRAPQRAGRMLAFFGSACDRHAGLVLQKWHCDVIGDVGHLRGLRSLR